MTLRAAFFDVGDTLVEHWELNERYHDIAREILALEFGERTWYRDLFVPPRTPELEIEDPPHRQETVRWLENWLRARGDVHDDLDLDRVRSLSALPLRDVSTLTDGAVESVRWCKAHGLKVVLVTNTLWRGDEEVWRDWRDLGLDDAIDGVVSSHSVGWRKPHRAMFDRALELGEARPSEAVMIGDSLEADVLGAQAVGLRAIWRKTPHGPAQPEGLVAVPDATIETLRDLPSVLAGWL